MRNLIAVGLLLCSLPVFAGVTVLYEHRAIPVQETLADPTDLWIRTGELTRVNGFELKPEGACIDDICVPVRQDQDSDIFITRSGQSWFNIAELADRLQQPYAVDYDQSVWSFGAIPVQRSSFVDDGIAPEFVLPDVDGEVHALSDFKGKKIMLLTWASW
jgi:hypothetical protein